MNSAAEPLCEVWRGAFLESSHVGQAVICGPGGETIEAWGEPGTVVLPRSSMKMIQALPLVTSGAADAFGLGPDRLALACASHKGAPMHVEAVNRWLAELGLGDGSLACGPQESRDEDLRLAMIRAGEAPCRVHNNCSGKHTGFLTLARHLHAGLDYVDPAHPVQRAVLEAFETVTAEVSPGHGVDGCSAPNYACTLHGLARAMAWFAGGGEGSLHAAGDRLVTAMLTHPDLVGGEGDTSTMLMRAATERVVVKSGAEGVFVAILADRGLGIALKAADGGARASKCAIAALLVRLGVVPAEHPDVAAFLKPEIRNWDGLLTGRIRPADTLLS